jgi:hypothetical protein
MPTEENVASHAATGCRGGHHHDHGARRAGGTFAHAGNAAWSIPSTQDADKLIKSVIEKRGCFDRGFNCTVKIHPQTIRRGVGREVSVTCITVARKLELACKVDMQVREERNVAGRIVRWKERKNWGCCRR